MNTLTDHHLSYTRVHVHFSPERDMPLNSWIGAIFRNSFLVNTSKVLLDDGRSLYEHIEDLQITESHPFYKQLSGGFPKGILIECRNLAEFSELKRGKIYTFSIVLIGSCMHYRQYVAEALRLMFYEGIGHPNVAAQYLEIENTNDEAPSVVSISDFELDENAPSHTTVKIDFVTPASLIRAKGKKDSSISFQDKLNGFPSFYQFMRTLASRFSTLTMLYGDCLEPLSVDEYIAASTDAILQKADIEFRKLRSTPKKGRNSVYVMEGYVGSIEWGNVPTKYLPLLAFGIGLGIGYNVQFGLGAYSINVKD